jgi:hypothetical protein
MSSVQIFPNYFQRIFKSRAHQLARLSALAYAPVTPVWRIAQASPPAIDPYGVDPRRSQRPSDIATPPDTAGSILSSMPDGRVAMSGLVAMSRDPRADQLGV